MNKKREQIEKVGGLGALGPCHRAFGGEAPRDRNGRLGRAVFRQPLAGVRGFFRELVYADD